MKTFAIGDIHGNYTELMQLLDKLEKEAAFSLAEDQLVITGDMVDSGKEVKQVLEWAMSTESLYPQHKFLMGNHEHLLLDALDVNHPVYGDYYLWYMQGGKETLKSYLPEDLTAYEKALASPNEMIPAEHIAWLKARPYYYENDQYFFVHGGVIPFVQLADHDFTDPAVLQEMLWIRDRFIDSTYKWEKKIIFGHTANVDNRGMYTPIIKKNKIGINTQPRVNMGYLTALQLPEEKFWRV